MREIAEGVFDRAFSEMIAEIRWQEEPQYYPRYRSRYLAMLHEFAELAPEHGVDLLDVGGGQLAYLSAKVWGIDRVCVADIDDKCFAALREHGIDTLRWNLALNDPPTDRQFDGIFFSEVIEHLPVPGHIPLARLRGLLRHGGLLMCSTPNLYRIRNVVFLACGRRLFDHFDLPGERGYGHVLEYSAEHLSWQLKQAGFQEFSVRFCDFTHVPNRRLDRMLAAFGAPIRRIPRYRDNLVAIAKAGTLPASSEANSAVR